MSERTLKTDATTSNDKLIEDEDKNTTTTASASACSIVEDGSAAAARDDSRKKKRHKHHRSRSRDRESAWVGDGKEKKERKEHKRHRHDKEHDQDASTTKEKDAITDDRKESTTRGRSDEDGGKIVVSDRKRRSRSRSVERKKRDERENGAADRDRKKDEREKPGGDRDRSRRERSPLEKRQQERSDRPQRADPPRSKPTTTIADIMRENPGIGLPEAIQRLNAINIAAAAAGEDGSQPAATTKTAAGHTSVANVNASTGIVGVGGAATKPFREVYIGNLPPNVSIPQLIEFLNAAMRQLGTTSSTGSVVSAWVSSDGHYGFAEFSTIEECNAAMAYLNGFQLGSTMIKVGRPSGFKAAMGMSTSTGTMAPGTAGLGSLATMLGPGGGANTTAVVGSMTTGTDDGSGRGENPSDLDNVILLDNLPTLLNSDQIRELVSPFGELSAFNVIQDPSGVSQAAVFKYFLDDIAEVAMSGLNGLQLGDMKLTTQLVPTSMVRVMLQPASSQSVDASGMPMSATGSEDKEATAPRTPKEVEILSHTKPSVVLRLDNMTNEEDLTRDDLHEEMIEDIAQECNLYGTVRSLEVPRTGEARGLVFVVYAGLEGAVKAKAAVSERTFNGNSISAWFYPHDLFYEKTYRVPDNYTLKSKPVNEDLD